MAYLVRVGHVPENISGVGSRGYQIFRRSTRVVVRWGGIDVVGRRFRWNGAPKSKVHPLRTVAKAKAFRIRTIKSQLEQGYSRLPPGARILPKRERDAF